MSFSNSKLDSFVQEVLQGNGLNKSASVGYAPPVENNQSVVDAVNKAYSHLTQEEVSMADTLGFMEAANTVKQANYINEQLGGERQMNFYNQAQNPYLAYKSAGVKMKDYVAGKADIAGAGFGKQGTPVVAGAGNLTPNQNSHKYSDADIDLMRSQQASSQEKESVKKAIAEYKAQVSSGGIFGSRGALRSGVSQHLVDVGAATNLVGLGAGKRVHQAVGAGVYGAGALGAGLLGHKMIRQRQALQKAKLEQSIGAKVLGHLGRHAGKYALGAGVAGLGALAYNSKAASDEAYLMDHAAQVGEAFIQKLASQAYENALVNELQLFREAAIDDVNAQQAYYGNGYGY